MSKLNRIALLVLAIIILTTFNPIQLNNPPQNFFFKIKNIEVLGTKIIDKKDITQRLVSIYDKNIFFIKKSSIKNPLEEIYFLDRIEVKKKYPSTIIIKVFESKPVAILIKNKKKYLLDSKSKLIPLNKNLNFDRLPNIFGENAENHFLFFLDELKKNNFPSEKIRDFYYFQIGRWDLVVEGNKIIKFPFDNVDKAIEKSIELLLHEDFKNYNIIDLRVPGKIIVE